MPKYKTVSRIIGVLSPYKNNSRTHSDEQVAQVAASIQEFGFTNPILIDENDGVIAGHGRLAAAASIGLKRVPCIILAGLTDDQKRAYIIADNNLALNASWDDDLLKAEIELLEGVDFDIGLLGFEDFQLDSIMKDPDFSPGDEASQGQLDTLDPVYKTCPHCGEEFNIREA